MNKNKLIPICLCLVFLSTLFVAIFFTKNTGKNIFYEDFLNKGNFLAAVKSAVKSSVSIKKSTSTKTSAPISAPKNIAERKKEPYLSLSTPFFDFISKAIPESIKQNPIINTNDVFSITNPKVITSTSNVQDSLVNIFCSQKIGNLRRIVTGSGVLIKNDLILSNAHVAVYPLAADTYNSVSCVVRSGSPAKSTHSVKTVFVSPEWVRKNGSKITSSYTETGEDDYAILKITPLYPLQKNNLQPLQIELSAPSIGSEIKAGGYPAGTLSASTINSSLAVKIENLFIKNLLTFNGYKGGTLNTDIIETSPSAIGQQGSSGGVITDTKNKVLGIISTVIPSEIHSKTLIHSLTTGNINRSLQTYLNGGFSSVFIFGTNDLESLFNNNYRTELTSIVAKALSL